MTREIGAYATKHPARFGIPKGELKSGLKSAMDGALFDAAFDALVASERIELRGERVRGAGQPWEPPAATMAALERIDHASTPRARLLDLGTVLVRPRPARRGGSRRRTAERNVRPGVVSLDEQILEDLGVLIGLKRQELQNAKPLPSTELAWAAWDGLMANRHWLEGIVANTCAERVNVPGYGKGEFRKRGWFGIERRRWQALFDLSESELEFFELHTEADIEHSDTGWRAVEKFAKELRMEDAAVAACERNLYVWEHYLNGIAAAGDARAHIEQPFALDVLRPPLGVEVVLVSAVDDHVAGFQQRFRPASDRRFRRNGCARRRQRVHLGSARATAPGSRRPPPTPGIGGHTRGNGPDHR